MSQPNFELRYTLQDQARGRTAFLDGIDATRDYLATTGATAGLAWMPTYSRLYAEIRRQAARGTFTNVVNGVGLIASMDQSYAPTLPEALQRFKDRAGTMSVLERARRLGVNVLQQRALMPPVLKSLNTLERMSRLLDDNRLFVNLYAEELPVGMTYNNVNAPYTRSTQLTPEIIEKLDTNLEAMPEQLSLCGITKLSFSPYNAERKSQSGNTQLPSWRSYLPQLTRQGLIRQMTISLRRQDLPATSGIDVMAATHHLASSLAQDTVPASQLGDLPEQIACIVENQPATQPLDVAVYGDVSCYRPGQVRNIYGNLDALFSS